MKNKVQPKTRKELIDIIKSAIQSSGGFNYNVDLNFIDTSKINNMSYLFEDSQFNGDISKWDVSNVTDMLGMFHNSEFNGDISKWDVSKVKSTSIMFTNSAFN